MALCWALYFLLTSTIELTELPSWHDEQRAIQVLLLALTAPAAIYAVCSIDIRLSAATAVSLAAFASLAVLSSSMAALPSHSFAELSLFVGLAGLAVLVAIAMSLRPTETWKAISMSCLLLGAAHVVGILTRYGAALSLGDSLGLDVLLLGFANPRFPSALYAVLMPFIAALAVDRTGQCGTRIAAVATLSLLWMVNIGLGTRAIFFAYLLAGLVYLFAAGRERARVQLSVLAATLGLGAVLYWLLFVAVPSLAGLTTVDIVRDPSSLAGASGRFELWLAGGSFLRDAPLLGIGPMHFAAFPHPYGAHPHSWPIQISAEYGLPAALLLTYLLWRLFRGVVRAFQRTGTAPGDGGAAALLACLVAVIYGLVDGNYLMPLSQSAMAIAFGVLLGSAGIFREPAHAKVAGHGRILATGATAIAIASSVYLVSYSWTSYAPQRSFKATITFPASGSRACLCR